MLCLSYLTLVPSMIAVIWTVLGSAYQIGAETTVKCSWVGNHYDIQISTYEKNPEKKQFKDGQKNLTISIT